MKILVVLTVLAAICVMAYTQPFDPDPDPNAEHIRVSRDADPEPGFSGNSIMGVGKALKRLLGLGEYLVKAFKGPTKSITKTAIKTTGAKSKTTSLRMGYEGISGYKPQANNNAGTSPVTSSKTRRSPRSFKMMKKMKPKRRNKSSKSSERKNKKGSCKSPIQCRNIRIKKRLRISRRNSRKNLRRAKKSKEEEGPSNKPDPEGSKEEANKKSTIEKISEANEVITEVLDTGTNAAETIMDLIERGESKETDEEYYTSDEYQYDDDEDYTYEDPSSNKTNNGTENDDYQYDETYDYNYDYENETNETDLKREDQNGPEVNMKIRQRDEEYKDVIPQFVIDMKDNIERAMQWNRMKSANAAPIKEEVEVTIDQSTENHEDIETTTTTETTTSTSIPDPIVINPAIMNLNLSEFGLDKSTDEDINRLSTIEAGLLKTLMEIISAKRVKQEDKQEKIGGIFNEHHQHFYEKNKDILNLTNKLKSTMEVYERQRKLWTQPIQPKSSYDYERTLDLEILPY